MLGHVEVRSG